MFEFQRQGKDLRVPEASENYIVRIAGVGGAGSNILERHMKEGGDKENVVIFNTDLRALNASKAKHRIQLGPTVTRGLGCGGDPEMGREAAEETVDKIREAVKGCHLLFLCAGLGGGTGSGASPVIARLAREEGCFVVVFVTLPFHFEGRRRIQQASLALGELRDSAGALLTFENDRMGELIVPKDGVQQAFAAADHTICQSIKAITMLLEKPGLIRVGMDDLLAVLSGQDARCLFGFGQAAGEGRATKALEAALRNPLLEQGNVLQRTSSVLVHISGNQSVSLAEVETVMKLLGESVIPTAQILFGVSANDDLGDSLCVALISSFERDESSRAVDSPLVTPAPKPQPAPVRPARAPSTDTVLVETLPAATSTTVPPEFTIQRPAPRPASAPAAEAADARAALDSYATATDLSPPYGETGDAQPHLSPSGPPKPALKRPSALPTPMSPAPVPRRPAPAAPTEKGAASRPPGSGSVKVDFAPSGPGDAAKPPGAQPTITLSQPKPSFESRGSEVNGSKAAPHASPAESKIVAMPNSTPPAPPQPQGPPPRKGLAFPSNGKHAASAAHPRGRFENVAPTMVNGQNLDIPTYLRKRPPGPGEDH